MAMSAPTATFVATLTMLTMTLAKVQDYVDGPPRPCRNRGGRWSQCRRASMGAVDPLANKGSEHTSVARLSFAD